MAESDDITNETLPELRGGDMNVRQSQIGRLEGRHVEVEDSQVGSLQAEVARVNESKAGFILARDLSAENTEAGFVIAFRADGAIRAQMDAQSIVLAAGAFAVVLFLLGRLFRRS